MLKKKIVSALILAGASVFTVFNFFSLFFLDISHPFGDQDA